MEAGWYQDPAGRYEQRLWNGTRWTAQVHGNGRVTADPYERAPVPEPARPEAPPVPGRPFLDGVREVLVRERIGVGTNVYDYLDADGRRIGVARQVRQAKAARVARVVYPPFTWMGTHEYDVHDAEGGHVLTLLRPARFIGSGTVHVLRPDRVLLGTAGQPSDGLFDLRVRREVVASVARTGWRFDYDVTDVRGAVVARLRKVFRGVATELATRADTYRLVLERPLDEPLRSLVLVTPLVLDEVLFQRR